tara:strand:- start:435 stop:953 length:519 start_codon:yes stop_codon:yes gene_type:complete
MKKIFFTRAGSATLMTIEADSGSNLVTVDGNIVADNFPTSSDDRLKHNEESIINPLSIIRQLKPYKYQKTKELKTADFSGVLDIPYKNSVGFIAQEVLAINDISFCVGGGDYTDESGNLIAKAHNLNYNNIFTYGIAGIKELDTKLSNLEAENIILKNALNSLLVAAGKPTV